MALTRAQKVLIQQSIDDIKEVVVHIYTDHYGSAQAQARTAISTLERILSEDKPKKESVKR